MTAVTRAVDLVPIKRTCNSSGDSFSKAQCLKKKQLRKAMTSAKILPTHGCAFTDLDKLVIPFTTRLHGLALLTQFLMLGLEGLSAFSLFRLFRTVSTFHNCFANIAKGRAGWSTRVGQMSLFGQCAELLTLILVIANRYRNEVGR